MVISIVANGMMVSSMEKGLILHRMDQNTLVTLEITNVTAKEYFMQQMALSFKKELGSIMHLFALI